MADRNSGKDFYRNLKNAKKSESAESASVPGNENLSNEEAENWKASESPDSDAMADIKQAQALSDEKFNKLKRKLLKGQIKLQTQDTKMRSEYAGKAYRFVWLWSIALIIIIILDGSSSPTLKFWSFEFHPKDFHLDPNVLIALITGVTVNIVAVFIVVMRNLFPSAQKDDDKKSEDKSEDKK